MIDLDILRIKSKRGKHKRVPKHLEEVFYQTLAFYPELKETYIIVVENKFYGIQHTLRAYPPLLSLLHKRKSRVYPIVINTNRDIPISFYNLSKEQQQGIFAHEMAHIVEYRGLTPLQVISFCLHFAFSKKFTCEMEQRVDKIAIAKGCGEYLLAQRIFFAQENKDQAHSEYVDHVYLNPKEIQQEMKKYPDIYPDIKDNTTQNLKPKTSNTTKPFPKRKHILQTIRAFTIAIVEMMRLIYIQRMHKKPNWYE